MNSKIYINQMLIELSFPFYDTCVRERDFMIYMNDDVDYHIFKTTTAWKRANDFKRMNWSIQFSDLNLIENLWRLIKLRINERRHQIHSVEKMKRAIEYEWNRLTSENFRRSIKSMHDRCKIVIKIENGSIKYWW